jgi:hypothetical protein
MNLKKNLYVVLTEYQFLHALNIATSIYSSSEYINNIYLVRKGLRLMGVDVEQKGEMDNITLTVFDNEIPKNVYNNILKENPNHFIFFQAISPLNVQMAYTLAKRGVEISLGPDGYGSYARFNKRYNILTIIKNSLKDNYFLYKNNLFSGKFHKFDYYKHGNNSFIDNLWITHPDQYVHRGSNKVNILRLPDFNKNCLKFVKKCFKFDEQFPTADAVYFFSHPLWDGMYEKELDFLKEVINKFPNKNIVIKLHPLTDLQTKLRYQALDTVHVIQSQVPAEVLLLSLRNCIVFTGWSTSLITENSSCNYYFNYPIYAAMRHPVLSQIEIVPLNHITMINSPEEMKFPNE